VLITALLTGSAGLRREISDDCHGWALDGEFRDRDLDDAGG
jgi:hypothetical protein